MLFNLNKYNVLTVGILVNLSIVLCGFSVLGQDTFKERTGSDLWGGSTAELYFSGHSNLFLLGNIQRSSFAGDRLGNSPVDETLLTLGYRHFIQEKWQLLVSQSRNRIVTGRRDITRGEIQHNGKIGSLFFLKTAGLEYLQFKDDLLKDDNFRVFASIYLGKRLKLKTKPFQIGFRYEAFRDTRAVGDPRRISETRLWIETELFVSKHFNLGFFAMRDTDYFFAEEVFEVDDDGNLVLTKPYRRLNLLTPTYGIRLRFILQPEKAHKNMPFNLFASYSK